MWIHAIGFMCTSYTCQSTLPRFNTKHWAILLIYETTEWPKHITNVVWKLSAEMHEAISKPTFENTSTTIQCPTSGSCLAINISKPCHGVGINPRLKCFSRRIPIFKNLYITTVNSASPYTKPSIRRFAYKCEMRSTCTWPNLSLHVESNQQIICYHFFFI
jgi:hypothetical protein